MSNNHATVWFTKDLPKEDMKRSLAQAQYNVVLRRLREIIDQRRKAVEAQDRQNLNNFTEGAWSHNQAFRNGAKQELYYLLEILNFVKGGDQ